MEKYTRCYAEIRKIMYGLKETRYLFNMELKRILAKEGYMQSKIQSWIIYSQNNRYIILIGHRQFWGTI